jgi:hypothetical protein
LAVTVRGTPQTPTGNPTTSGNITVPATVVTGDPCLVWVTSRDSTGAGTLSVTDNDTGGNTWTKIANSTDHKATLWYKRATSGTAGKTVTVNNAVGSLSFVFKAFAGAIDTGNAYADITVETNISGNETHAGFTPSVPDAWVWLSVHNYNNDNAVTAAATATNPGTLNTSVAEKLSTGGSDSGCHVAGKAQVGAAAATGNFTWAQTDGVTYSIVGIIKPLTVPNAPTVAAESSVTETSFSANWTAPGSGPAPTSYEIDVATDAGFTAIVSGYNGLDVGNVLTKSVTGLSAATNYWYRVRAVNSIGESANSGSEPVTTSTPSPPGAPTANDAYPVLGNSFVASWSAPGSGGTPTYYELDVATDSGFTAFVSGYNGLNVGLLRRYSVTGLAATTSYWYRVRAGNGGGESADSNAKTLTTTTAVTYVFRDEFITPDAAPVTSPRTAEPGSGTLTFVQIDGAQAIAGNRLEFTAQTTPAWGDQGFYSNSITRAIGRAIRWEMTPGTNGQVFLGINNDQAVGSYGQDLHNLFFSGNTSLKYNIENRDHYSRGLTPGTTYQLAIVLATEGVHYLVKGGAQYPEWMRIYRSVWDTTSPIYIDFGNYDHTSFLDNLRVVDLPAPWDTDTGGASTYLAGSQGLNQTFTHDADGNLDFKVVTRPTVANLEIAIRRQDANNYWFIRVTSAGDVGLYEVVGGAGAVQRGLATGTVGNGAIVSIRAEQATIAALIQGRETQWSYELADNFYTETDGEIITLDLGADVADITSWPLYLSGAALTSLEGDGGTASDARNAVANITFGAMTTTAEAVSTIEAEADITFGAMTVTATATVQGKASADFTFDAMTLDAQAVSPIEAVASFMFDAMTVTSTAVVTTPNNAVADFTFAPMTLSATVTSTMEAAATFTYDPMTLTAAAVSQIKATAGFAFEPMTMSGSAAVLGLAAANFTFDAMTVTATATARAGGTADFTFDPMTLAAAAALQAKAAASFTFDAMTVAATAEVITPGAGLVANFTFGAMTLTATATARADAAASFTYDAMTLAATAALQAKAVASFTFDPMTTSGAAVSPIEAAVDLTFGAMTLDAQAAAQAKAVANLAFGAMTVTATASSEYPANEAVANLTFDAMTVTSAVVSTMRASASFTFGPMSLTATAVVVGLAAADFTFAPMTLDAQATLRTLAEATFTFEPMTLSAQGRTWGQAAADFTFSPMTITAMATASDYSIPDQVFTRARIVAPWPSHAPIVAPWPTHERIIAPWPPEEGD